MANKAMEQPVKSKPRRAEKKKGWVRALIGIIVVIVIGSVIYMNREKVAIYTQNIPILNQIFSTGTDTSEETMGITEAINALEEANKKVAQFNEMIETKNLEIEQLNTQIDLLKEYEQYYLEFQQQKASWDENIAKTNPDLFIEQFELIHPETAQEIYETLKSEEVWHKEYKQYANMIGSMDESKAAEALEQLLTTDTTLVQQIFEHMDIERQALILNEMSTGGATQVIKLISPE